MEDIRIDVGVDTILEVDLSEMVFDGIEAIIFTVKNMPNIECDPIIERKFTTAEIHKIKITAEESIKLTERAQYDFQKLLTDGTRIKMTDNGNVRLRWSVGDKFD